MFLRFYSPKTLYKSSLWTNQYEFHDQYTMFVDETQSLTHNHRHCRVSILFTITTCCFFFCIRQVNVVYDMVLYTWRPFHNILMWDDTTYKCIETYKKLIKTPCSQRTSSLYKILLYSNTSIWYNKCLYWIYYRSILNMKLWSFNQVDFDFKCMTRF